MKLALFGGIPVIRSSPRKYTWYKDFDFSKLEKIIYESNLSGFLANPNEGHFGGENILLFESKFGEIFNSKFSISFNSWTSGLEAAIAALDLPKGSEVIVPAWTMSATLAAIVHNGLRPHFVDISKLDFNLDIEVVKTSISANTTAVLGVDIFGKPCKATQLRELCNKYNLKFIVDSAQTPKALDGNFRTSQLSDVGGYSLNRHKHLQVGEGGVAVTNDQIYANRMAQYRNHAEVTNLGEDRTISFGHNLRMGEMEAVLAIYQLSKFNELVEDRRNYGRYLKNALKNITWLEFGPDEIYKEHDYYILGMRIKLSEINCSRDLLIRALTAEGITGLVSNYSNLHKNRNFLQYPRSSMVVTEELCNNSFLGLYLCGNQYTNEDLSSIVEAFLKIDKYKFELANT
jgi:perosamine synthetase